MLKKLFGIFIVLLSLNSASVKPSFAQQEFTTSYSVDYAIQTSGITRTKFAVTLTNKLSNIYATEFTLSIGSTKLLNIKVYNSAGDLEPKIIKGDKTTNVTILFKDKVLGKDKSQIFYLEFDSLDFANQLGSVWEISIPKLSRSKDLSSYQLTLSVPLSFGIPANFTPTPISQTENQDYTIYRFSQKDLFEKGISATFGQRQYFDFSLIYHLENSKVYPVKTEIALPPDTAFQKVLYQTLDPLPDNVTTDLDGNWLASYTLGAKESIKITATGSAILFLKRRPDFPASPLADPNVYLSSQKFWEVNSQGIQNLSSQLKTPSSIYQYIVNNLIYDYGRLTDNITRFGAANALDNPDSAICMEFTDLFIALTRAAGTPSRAVNGFAYTTNLSLRPLSLKKDVLHAWPEYFDSQSNTWIPVDPTWGNTTGGIDFFSQLDLNHFVFAILGQDSNYPVPAGGYKTQANQTKDVEVLFGLPPTSSPKSTVELDLPQKAIAGVDLNGKIIITNTGNTALYNQTVNLSSNNFSLSQTQWVIEQLPPFASVSIPFTLSATSFTDSLIDNLTLSTDLASTTHQLTLVPAYQYFFFNPTVIKTAILILILALAWLTFKLKSSRL